jgi:hypothetical protein
MTVMGGSRLSLPLAKSSSPRCGGTDGDAALAPGCAQNVPPLDVEIGDLADHLFAVATEETGMAVRSLHPQGVVGVPRTEERGDLDAALRRLPYCREQGGKCR